MDAVTTLPPWAVALVGQLAAEHDDIASVTLVEQLVRDELATLANAPVHEFLPVFVERRVRRRLRSSAQVDTRD
jgi:hypothetical protein